MSVGQDGYHRKKIYPYNMVDKYSKISYLQRMVTSCTNTNLVLCSIVVLWCCNVVLLEEALIDWGDCWVC